MWERREEAVLFNHFPTIVYSDGGAGKLCRVEMIQQNVGKGYASESMIPALPQVHPPFPVYCAASLNLKPIKLWFYFKFIVPRLPSDSGYCFEQPITQLLSSRLAIKSFVIFEVWFSRNRSFTFL